MNRRKLLKGIAALSLSEHLLQLQTAWAAGERPAKPGLHSVSGTVSINGQAAQAGMPVRPGDRIVTGPGSQAIYVVGNDAYLQRDRSTVDLLGSSVTSGLRVLSGKLLSVFGKGEKRLETPTATIGIRGTACYIEASAERVYFCLCYGKADVVPTGDPSQRESVETRHHDKPMYITAQGNKLMVPAGVENHSDDELILLEGLVGRLPPFYGSSQRY